MKCPQCQSENADNAKYCTHCGSSLEIVGAGAVDAAKAASASTFSMGKKSREARIQWGTLNQSQISSRAYNLTILGVLVWGLLINFLLCHFVGDRALRITNPIVFFIGYLVLVFGGIAIINHSRSVGMSLLGYHMVVIPFGLVVGIAVAAYTKLDPTIVQYAFLYTLLISVGMMTLSLIRPQLFEHMGGVLMGALLGVFICEIVLMLFHVRQGVTNWIVAAIFSLYIGYDVYRSQMYPKTFPNAVNAALDLYLDITNLFMRIMDILAAGKSSSSKS